MNLVRIRTRARRYGARTFFEHVCPTLLRASADVPSLVSGSLSFSLDAGCGGVWTIDLAGRRCEAGASPKPDLKLEMRSSDFESMLEGRFDLARGIREGRAMLEGPRYLLLALAEILRTSELEAAPRTRKEIP